LRYFSNSLELEASIFIQARSLADAQSKLIGVVSKDIDACDMRWFSDRPFGSKYFPELSFGTDLRVCHIQSDESFEEIESHDLWHLMRSRDDNGKRHVLPMSRDWFGEGKLPIYAACVVMRTTCYIKAISLQAAQVFVAHMKDKRFNRYEDDRIFWDYAFLGLSQIALSPNMLVATVSHQGPLKLIYMGDPNAVVSDVVDGSKVEALEQHKVAADIRGALRRMGSGFEDMADDNAFDIASLLIEYRDKPWASQRTTVSGEMRNCPP
jgi:hypothetical protein